MKKRILTAIIGIALTLPLFGEISFAQEKSKEDRVKLYKEIAGDYEFDTSDFGQDVMVIIFYEEDGSLFGSPEGETPEEIFPIEDEELKFEITTTDGEEFELTFVRDKETKKITKCIWKVISMDVELEGIKVKDGD
jgi:hypothetical protein